MISFDRLNSMEPFEEIIPDDSASDSKENEDKMLTKFEKSFQQSTSSKSLLKKNFYLRGLLPHERDKDFNKILNSPIIRRCCIEHGYFFRNRMRNSRYNFRNLSSNKTNTVPFENEQPTIDVERLASKLKSVYVKDSSNENNVIFEKEKNPFSSSSSSSSNYSGRNSPLDNSDDRDLCPENTTTESDTDTASVDSCHFIKEIRKTNSKSILKNDSKKSHLKNLGVRRIPIKFYKVNDYFEKLKVMQKLLKTKGVNEKGKTGKTPPPSLKKMIGQRKSENILKMSDYLFPMPNLTKMVNGGKNWKMEYMDDEVQNFGLDDLLLKASELNAENFTKALGRKLEPMKMNFNNKDNSEIVFTIPKSKKNPEEVCENENDFSKRNSLKTIKLDISKPFFESDKPKDTEITKPLEDVSPKKPGIKVKTVENINEEFKDSLGRLNGIDKDITVGIAGTGFGVSIREPEIEKIPQEESEKDVEGSRPFIMTIIQSKTEKQRPAILRNSYLKKKTNADKREKTDKSIDCRVESEIFPREDFNENENEKTEESADIRSLNSQLLEKGFNRNLCREGYVNYAKVFDDSENDKNHDEEGRFIVKKRNIPFILNHSRKARSNELMSGKKTPNKLVKVNEKSEKPLPNEKAFKITSIEQKLGPKETNRRFIKVVPYEPINKSGQQLKAEELQAKLSDEEVESPQKDEKISHVLSLTAFSTILKQILPDKWFLCLDKKHGLQVIKTHMDESLNPSILISVVIARCGKLTVNVRGKQLPKNHELFSNICDISNSENKLSLNYVLAIINKLRHRSVCFGCDDPSLKKYWSGDGFIENQTEFQQVYRSHICQLLVSLGKRRCYPCYRINESLKKRSRRDKLDEKAKEEKEKDLKEVIEEEEQKLEQTPKTHLHPRGMKRNLEDFLEESFSTMKQQIVDEIEKNKKLGERENALKAQEEVLSFMGLTRKESLDNPVRKSKRKKNSFYKLQQPVKKKTDQKELEFLEKYWTDINTLFSTSLLFGAYSRTGRGRLREKCRMFKKLLSTWKNIVTSNPEWIGEISFPDELTDGDNPLGKESVADQFEKMDVPALRAYIINSVKEVNRIKHKLRTRNSYFKVLYNKFVKRRMKRPKTLVSNSQKGTGSSATSTTNTPTPTDFSSDENSRDKGKIVTDDNPPAQALTNCETEEGAS